MTPVFDEKHIILGYLDAQAHRDERTFKCLDRIRGFKWFAEVHGKRIPRLDAKIA